MKLEDLKYESRDRGSLQAALTAIEKHLAAIKRYTGEDLVITKKISNPEPLVNSEESKVLKPTRRAKK